MTTEVKNEVQVLVGQIEAKNRDIEQKLQTTGAEAAAAKAEALKAIDDIKTLTNRVDEAIQRMKDRWNAGQVSPQSFGAAVMASASVKSFIAGTAQRGTVEVKSPLFGQTVAGSADSTVIAPQRLPDIVAAPLAPLTILDLIPVIPTSTNLIEYTREVAFDNQAAFKADRSAPAESTFTFAPASEQVRTIAHYTKIHKNMLADAPQIEGFINVRMLHGLRKKLEAQIIGGNGQGQNLNGMFLQGRHLEFTPQAGEHELDSINRALEQAELAGYPASVVITNTSSWYAISRLKSAQGEYLVADPLSGLPSLRIWNKPVVASPAVPAGKFLVCDLPSAYAFFNRAEATVSVYNQNEDDALKGLVTMLAEARGALANWSVAAAVAGDIKAA